MYGRTSQYPGFRKHLRQGHTPVLQPGHGFARAGTQPYMHQSQSGRRLELEERGLPAARPGGGLGIFLPQRNRARQGGDTLRRQRRPSGVPAGEAERHSAQHPGAGRALGGCAVFGQYGLPAGSAPAHQRTRPAGKDGEGHAGKGKSKGHG